MIHVALVAIRRDNIPTCEKLVGINAIIRRYPQKGPNLMHISISHIIYESR